MIVRDVDCPEIPGFVDEEIQNVDRLKNGDKDQRGRNTTIFLVLIGDG